MLYIYVYIYICINANAIASSWRYNFLWPKAELMLKHPKSSLWRYDTRLNNSKRRTVKLSFIAASRYEPLKTGTLQPGIKTQNTGTLVTHVDSVTAAVSQCFSFLCCSDSQCERSFGTSVKTKSSLLISYPMFGIPASNRSARLSPGDTSTNCMAPPCENLNSGLFLHQALR